MGFGGGKGRAGGFVEHVGGLGQYQETMGKTGRNPEYFVNLRTELDADHGRSGRVGRLSGRQLRFMFRQIGRGHRKTGEAGAAGSTVTVETRLNIDRA